MSSIENLREFFLNNRNEFVKWPQQALLLWDGCVKIQYHQFPTSIKSALKSKKIQPDSRTNGPAVNAFLLAGGERPLKRNGHGWPVHHLYFGLGEQDETISRIHSVRHGKHFTQAAGLVAIHPVAHAFCEEDWIFTRSLCEEAFNRFHYDPQWLFSKELHDEFGFVGSVKNDLIYVAGS